MLTEDAEKRRVRRERNKLAASKCRKKRKDHVRNLVEVNTSLHEVLAMMAKPMFELV